MSMVGSLASPVNGSPLVNFFRSVARADCGGLVPTSKWPTHLSWLSRRQLWASKWFMSDDLEWVKYYGQQAAGCVRHARLMRPQKTISNFEVYAGPDSSVV